MNKVSLVYVHDPMCSWCFGFSQTHRVIMKNLVGRIPVRRLLGGLAADTEEPMPLAMQDKLQKTWQRIEQAIPGVVFNYEFWKKCEPRRATYPACRAVIAARVQDDQFDPVMTEAIQEAYYRDARNPSDHDTLVRLAEEIGLDVKRFDADLTSDQTQQQLLDEIDTARSIGIKSFPSLAVISESTVRHIDLAYTDPELMLKQINAAAIELLP